MTPAPRVVLVHRRTELEALVDQHGTRGQAEFFLRSRGRSLGEVQDRHDRQAAALGIMAAGVPVDWRRGSVERDDLMRFVFEPGDVLVVVGQDGLVANAAKYLDGQSVLGVDPEPGRNPAVLVRHSAGVAVALLRSVADRSAVVQHRTMARAELDDGQRMDSVNEVFVGHASHQSARYVLALPGGGEPERQSSSGLIVATGTGSTGWAASISHDRGTPVPLPGPEDPTLAWFVREAWPSPVTGASLTVGLLGQGGELSAVVESNELVVFGDGLESDHLVATWGQTVTLSVSPRVLNLVA